MKWKKIRYAPKDNTTVDIWCGEYNERHANMMRVDLGNGNVFYDPVKSGRCCVRSATHFIIVEPPTEG